MSGRFAVVSDHTAIFFPESKKKKSGIPDKSGGRPSLGLNPTFGLLFLPTDFNSLCARAFSTVVPERFPRLCQSVFHGCARPFLLCVSSLEGALEIGF